MSVRSIQVTIVGLNNSFGLSLIDKILVASITDMYVSVPDGRYGNTVIKTSTDVYYVKETIEELLPQLPQLILGGSSSGSLPDNIVIDANYVHTDNNYSAAELAAVAYVKPNLIAHTLSVPFTKALTKMATHTMVANIEFAVDNTDAVDTSCAQQLLVNNALYSATFSGFVVFGEHDNTKTHTILTFEKIGTLYIVNIANSIS